MLVRALRLWRTFKAFRHLLDDAIAETVARVARESRAAGPGSDTHQLESALARLRTSVSRAAVLGRAAALSVVARCADTGCRAEQMTRVGAIDIGTNSTRLLIADVDGERLSDLERRSVVTRLGEGVDAGRLLLPDAIARVHAALDGFRGALEAVELTLCRRHERWVRGMPATAKRS